MVYKSKLKYGLAIGHIVTMMFLFTMASFAIILIPDTILGEQNQVYGLDRNAIRLRAASVIYSFASIVILSMTVLVFIMYTTFLKPLEKIQLMFLEKYPYIRGKNIFNDIIEGYRIMQQEIAEGNEKLSIVEVEMEKQLAIIMAEKEEIMRKKTKDEEEINHSMLLMLEDLNETNKRLSVAESKLKNENKIIESEVIQRTKELLSEKKKVEFLLKQKTNFVNQLSHDLRTPLAPLKTLLPYLAKSAKDDVSRKDAEVCIRNTEYLSNLVIDTLSLARLDSGKIKFNLGKANMSRIVDEVINENGAIFNEKQIVIENNLVGDIYVEGDPLRIKEVMQNLQMNSVKFMPGGGKLIFAAEENGDEILFSVTDTGIGMSRETLSKIFREFYKVDESRHDLGSSGLGLTISKRIIEMHGGRMWAYSDGPDKGSTFYFSLKRFESEK